MFNFTHTLTILSSLLLLLVPVNCGEAAVVRTGEGAENPNVEECLLEPATIEPAGSDVGTALPALWWARTDSVARDSAARALHFHSGMVQNGMVTVARCCCLPHVLGFSTGMPRSFAILSAEEKILLCVFLCLFQR